METNCRSFLPIVDGNARHLVLGSMPGVASLRAQQYYAHPRNAFWRILYALFGGDLPDASYDARTAFARAHGVAIWDVCDSCQREGSSDAAMRNITVHDFSAFFAAHPHIERVYFNGGQARIMFYRNAKGAAGERPCVLLPSTSPAHTMPFDEKLAQWRRAFFDGEQRD